MKKTLTLLLLVLTLVVISSCKKDKNDTTTTGGNTTTTEDPGTVVDDTYTYAFASLGMPNNFNVHIWETNTDSMIMNYTEMGLYDFVLNEEMDGYDIISEMAAGNPVDVTLDYAENTLFDVPDDAETGYAFKIALNEDAKWANGTVINADTYIYSMQQLLNPEMQNYRADGYITGTLVIDNAEEYLKQGQSTFITLGKYMETFGIGTLAEAITQATTEDLTTYINWVYSFGDDLYSDDEPEDKVVATDKTLAELYADYKAEVLRQGWTDEAGIDEWVLDELYVQYTFPVLDWENVGLIKTGEYEITLVLAKPITDFYLKYNLSSNWIVYEDLYEAGKVTIEGGSVSTNYATSVSTYMAYGPYKLVTYQDDKLIALTKNDEWYGYSDINHEGQFQATDIEISILADHNTTLLSYLSGDLDEVGLTQEDVDEFKFSENLLYEPESYSSKLTFNTDPVLLKEHEDAAGSNVDKEIFANIKFREAISLALNRQDFVQTQTAGSQATLGLYNSLYVSNVDTGEIYNTTQAYANILNRIYGTDYPTGYDLEKATQLFQEAYDEQFAAGKIDADDIVEIEFSIYKFDNAYTDKVIFLQNALNDATFGTDLQGRIIFSTRTDAKYYDSAERGDFDVIWATWGGMSMDPFGFMQVYTVNGTHNEYGFDPETETFTMVIDGTDVTKTYYNWYIALNEGEYSAMEASYELRLEILAEMEYNILIQYRTIPVYARTSLVMISDKINYATDEFVPLVVFGGIRSMTFNFTDAEWEDYASNEIDYTD